MSRKKFTTTIQEDTHKQIKKLVIDLDCSVNELIEQGINCVLKENTRYVRENVVEFQGSEKPKKKTRKPKK